MHSSLFNKSYLSSRNISTITNYSNLQYTYTKCYYNFVNKVNKNNCFYYKLAFMFIIFLIVNGFINNLIEYISYLSYKLDKLNYSYTFIDLKMCCDLNIKNVLISNNTIGFEDYKICSFFYYDSIEFIIILYILIIIYCIFQRVKYCAEIMLLKAHSKSYILTLMSDLFLFVCILLTVYRLTAIITGDIIEYSDLSKLANKSSYIDTNIEYYNNNNNNKNSSSFYNNSNYLFINKNISTFVNNTYFNNYSENNDNDYNYIKCLPIKHLLLPLYWYVICYFIYNILIISNDYYKLKIIYCLSLMISNYIFTTYSIINNKSKAINNSILNRINSFDNIDNIDNFDSYNKHCFIYLGVSLISMLIININYLHDKLKNIQKDTFIYNYNLVYRYELFPLYQLIFTICLSLAFLFNILKSNIKLNLYIENNNLSITFYIINLSFALSYILINKLFYYQFEYIENIKNSKELNIIYKDFYYYFNRNNE